jgi:hypothetical protein
MNRKALIGTSYKTDYGVTVHLAPASSKCEKQVIHFTGKRSQKELLRHYIFRLAIVAVEETFYGVQCILTLQLCLL